MNDSYNKEFLPYVNKWGRITNGIVLLLSLCPIAVVFFVYNLVPTGAQMLAAVTPIISVMVFLWIVEPIAYFPVLGISGTYMAFMSGNISNLKVPASAVAQDAAGVENGTPEGGVISTIAIAASTVVCLAFVTAAVFLGAGVLAKLPASVTGALNFLLPALFGGLLAKFASSQPRLGIFAIVVAVVVYSMVKLGVFSFLPAPGGNPSYVVIFCTVIGTMLFAKLTTKASSEKK